MVGSVETRWSTSPQGEQPIMTRPKRIADDREAPSASYARAGRALAAIAVTMRPYPDWHVGGGPHAQRGEPAARRAGRDVLGVFGDGVIGEQLLLGRSMAEKEVYLGVEVQTRDMVDRASRRPFAAADLPDRNGHRAAFSGLRGGAPGPGRRFGWAGGLPGYRVPRGSPRTSRRSPTSTRSPRRPRRGGGAGSQLGGSIV